VLVLDLAYVGLEMPYYERNMPHYQPDGAAIFVTWCLHGTHGHTRKTSGHSDAGRAFAEMDRVMDKAASGPKWLQNSEVAGCVEEALHFGEHHLHLYKLLAYVVMPNHVHVVLVPKSSLPQITKSLKGFTARKANEILGRTGEKFWQDESYDHCVRSSEELQRVIKYVERNPVRAGLVASIEDWMWSSANPKSKSNSKSNTGMNACATSGANTKIESKTGVSA